MKIKVKCKVNAARDNYAVFEGLDEEGDVYVWMTNGKKTVGMWMAPDAIAALATWLRSLTMPQREPTFEIMED